jgi:pre-rRNA-processing protein RIX1
MSHQYELRALCHQLSSTPSAQLPYITPILLRNVSLYRSSFSEELNTSKTRASESSSVVHKLKIQLSTLLYGKSSEGRLCAVVLIKAIIEVGGPETLKSSGSWVRGLLSILEVCHCAIFMIRLVT